MSEYIEMNDTPVYNYQKDIIKEKGKVINDLLKRISDLEFEVEKQDKELEYLEKLNNANYQSFIETNKILIKLEKYINKTKLEEFEKEYGRRYGKTFTQAEVIVCNMILARLKILKGVDKE